MLLSIFLNNNIVILHLTNKTKKMKLSDVKQILPTLENVEFQLENGTFVPEHFHVTEIGQITKNLNSINKRQLID